jgi:serine protease Do
MLEAALPPTSQQDSRSRARGNSAASHRYSRWVFESEDDEPAGRQPLPPEDRLWRHPSEMRGQQAAPPVPQRSRRGSLAVAAGSALAGALLVAGGWLAVATVDDGDSPAPGESAGVKTVVSAPPRDDSWTKPIAAALGPSLPSIKALKGGRAIHAAGVVIDSSGHIVTSATVVGTADVILVFGPDGVRSSAQLVALDRVTDIAVIRTERVDLVPAPLALTRPTRIGQYALARTDDGDTSPDGRVVAISTSVPGPSGEILHGVIAYSSPEDPPVPGAGVFDDAGEVFAVTTSAKAVSAERMGHGIPASLVAEVAQQLITEGRASHPWLGIQGTDLPSTVAVALETSGGVAITGVTKNGPAAVAGLLEGDAVVSANGQMLRSMADLVIVLREAGAGTIVDLQAVRAGAIVTISPELGER